MVLCRTSLALLCAELPCHLGDSSAVTALKRAAPLLEIEDGHAFPSFEKRMRLLAPEQEEQTEAAVAEGGEEEQEGSDEPWPEEGVEDEEDMKLIGAATLEEQDD